jgi:flagellar basal-body rod modification protein FlgD
MPNAISPLAASPAAAAAATTTPVTDGSAVGPGGKLGKDEFLKLLTTQMRYQDPMNPMDGSRMAADLAQFSGLEQLVNVNAALAAQKTESDSMLVALNNAVAMNAIGKTVVATGDQMVLTTDSSGQVVGKVMADITTEGNGTLKILDAAGKEIASRSLGYLAVGAKREFDVGSAAVGLKEGAYKYEIDVTDANGKVVPQTSYTVGKIDGISYDSTGAVMTSGPLTITINNIVKILS